MNLKDTQGFRFVLVSVLCSLVFSSLGAYDVRAHGDHEEYEDGRSGTQIAAAQIQALAVPNLVAAFSFNENTGTVASDNSGNTNTATLTNGAAWTAGVFDSAVSLDGSNDFVSVADSASLDVTGPGTISAWVKLNALNRWHGIFAKGAFNDPGHSYNYAIEINESNRAMCMMGNGSAVNSVTSSATLSADQFAHVACTWDGSQVRIFVNGVQSGQVSQTLTPSANNHPLLLGKYGGDVDFMQGVLDEVRVYDRALSATEIQTDMETPMEPDLEAPTVSIVSPEDGSSVSGMITLTADAADNLLVAGVQFLLDGTPLELEDSTAPYEINWNTSIVPNGSHTLVAQARDGSGNVTASSPVAVTVNNVPDSEAPIASITNPTGGTVSGTVTVSADATDNIGVIGVQFLLDGSNLGAEDTAAPYSISWNTIATANGLHTISAIARDSAGNNTTTSSVAVNVLNTDLVLAMSFNEGTGTVANDISGQGNNGTLSGPVWTTQGRYGGALQFDGSNDLVNVADANSLDLTNGMTLEAWVNPANLTGWKTFITKENGSNNLAYSLSANNNASNANNQRPVSRIRIGNNTRTVTGTSKLSLNNWMHVASTYDGSVLRLYINGTQVASLNTTGNITTTNNLLRIGGAPALGSQYFNGRIDEVRVYKRALSASEIQSDMNTPVEIDTQAPSVSITAPANDATVVGATSITASASDNIGVAGVQFMVDGNSAGPEDVTAPYSLSWDSSLVANGTHSITAVARDASGNTTTATAVNVTVANPPKLVITTPTSGASVAGSTLNITYDAIGDTEGYGVNHVHFRIDGGPEIMDFPPMDGVFQIPNLSAGPHTLDGFLVRVDHSKIDGTDAAQVPFTITLPDEQAPVVSVTSPLEGSTVAGNVTLGANASDNVGVAGVQFMVDGNNVGTEDTIAPFTATWNTSSFSSGSHVITARARDAAGNNTTSSPVTVTVTNPNDPAVVGQWSSPFSLPMVAVHLAQLHTGDILMWSGQSDGGVSARVWNPATGSLTPAPNNFINLFCAGHVQLADGTIMTVGGHSGSPGVRLTSTFDPNTQTWTRRDDMNFIRWYPTATTLGDGRVVVMSGSEGCSDLTCSVDQVEVYDPLTNDWTTLPATANRDMPLYPLNFTLPDGRVLNAGAYDGPSNTAVLDLNTNAWTVVDPTVIDSQSAVMYAPGKIMKSGVSTPSVGYPIYNSNGRTFVLDMNQANPAWRETAQMNFPRVFNVNTLLPDGTTLVTGGSRSTDQLNNGAGVLEAEIWNPNTETWSAMARATNPRLYHGSAILLPDGRVLMAGGGANIGTNFFNGEIFSPPYLFKGPRPTISSAPTTVPHNSQFFVGTPNGSSISKVTMIRSGTMTHSFNPDQRFLDLEFTQTAGGLTVTAPVDANTAPPGYYMLFAVNDQGVPSVASFIRLPSSREDSVAPSAPTNLEATGGLATASLTWTAATDNIGVARYHVYRSTVPAFTPNGGNHVGQVTTTSFTNNGLAAGTYYYKVLAEDAAGNVGPASNEAEAIATSDTTPPTGNLTAPIDGATVSGTITLSANAADDVSVAGVQFKLDGNNLGTEDTSAPYSLSWNTFSTSNGAHTVSAVVRDASGNTFQVPSVTITVSNTALPVNFGYATVGGTTDSGDENTMNAIRFTMPNETGSMQSMSVNVGSIGAAPNNQFSMAVYTDNGGNPGTLVASTINGTLTANSWNTLPISGTLQPNTTYWLAYNTNGTNGSLNNFKMDPGSSQQMKWRGFTFGSWPTTFGSTTGSSNWQASMYVTYLKQQ